MNKVPLTVVGAEKLRAELQRLKTVERPRIIQLISEARSHGDLSENAEYHSAKEQQSFVEGRIADIAFCIDICAAGYQKSYDLKVSPPCRQH